MCAAAAVCWTKRTVCDNFRYWSVSVSLSVPCSFEYVSVRVVGLELVSELASASLFIGQVGWCTHSFVLSFWWAHESIVCSGLHCWVYLVLVAPLLHTVWEGKVLQSDRFHIAGLLWSSFLIFWHKKKTGSISLNWKFEKMRSNAYWNQTMDEHSWLRMQYSFILIFLRCVLGFFFPLWSSLASIQFGDRFYVCRLKHKHWKRIDIFACAF